MADITKIKPSIAHHFESIGDFYICSMSFGQYLELSKLFVDVDDTNSPDILKFCFSKMAYEDADCELSLDNETIDKVTLGELIQLFDELIEKSSLISFSKDMLTDDLKLQYEGGEKTWPPEERIAFILRHGVIAPLTKTGEKIFSSYKNLINSFSKPFTTAFGQSMAASSVLGKQIEAMKKQTIPIDEIRTALYPFHDDDDKEYQSPLSRALPEIDPSAFRNPIHDTNDKLDEFNSQIQIINETSIATATVINQLNETVMAFLLDFKEAADKTNRSSGLMLKIAVFSLVLTCVFSLASLGVAIMSYRDSDKTTDRLASIAKENSGQAVALNTLSEIAHSHDELMVETARSMEANIHIQNMLADKLDAMGTTNQDIKALLEREIRQQQELARKLTVLTGVPPARN
jgi:hypothetical protein